MTKENVYLVLLVIVLLSAAYIMYQYNNNVLYDTTGKRLSGKWKITSTTTTGFTIDKV